MVVPRKKPGTAEMKQRINGGLCCDGGQGRITNLIYVCGPPGCRCAWLVAPRTFTVLLQTLMATVGTGAVYCSVAKPDLCLVELYMCVPESAILFGQGIY